METLLDVLKSSINNLRCIRHFLAVDFFNPVKFLNEFIHTNHKLLFIRFFCVNFVEFFFEERG